MALAVWNQIFLSAHFLALSYSFPRSHYEKHVEISLVLSRNGLKENFHEKRKQKINKHEVMQLLITQSVGSSARHLITLDKKESTN